MASRKEWGKEDVTSCGIVLKVVKMYYTILLNNPLESPADEEYLVNGIVLDIFLGWRRN